MRILVATGLYPPESGGPATYSKLLEEKLPALGFEASVLPFSRVRHLPKGIRHVVYFLRCTRKARRADIIYAQDTASVGLPAALAALVAGKKFVVRVPGDYAWEQARQRFGVTDGIDTFQEKKYGWRVELLRSVQRFVMRRAVRIIVPSFYMKDVVSGWTSRDKVEVVYSSIDTPHATALAERPQGFLIVSVGRDVPWKGFDALERVAERKKDWHLYIGKDIPHEQALAWIKAADVFVLNSTYEGLSHVLVEAMMLGTPVVATAVGGNLELVGSGRGLLVAPQNDNELFSAIQKVEQDPAAARERAVLAKKFAEVQCGAEASIAKLGALLKEI